LVGIAAFAAWAIQTAQHLVEPRLQLVAPLTTRTERYQQFLKHALEDDGIVRQVSDRAGRGSRHGRGGVHTLLDASWQQIIGGILWNQSAWLVMAVKL